jgi:hypothetical protein
LSSFEASLISGVGVGVDAGMSMPVLVSVLSV